MWIVDKDTNKWTIKSETLDLTDFESIKKDLKSLRIYQKCLSGSTYVSSKGTDDIYDVLGYSTFPTFNYNSSFSPYILPYSGVISNEYAISSTYSQMQFEKYNVEYGLTLKNLFTPQRLINDQSINLKYVDVSTTEPILSIGSYTPGLVIDNIRLKEGHRVLVKDQFNLITIPTSVNPEIYFDGYYEVIEEIGTNTQYKIHNSDNGVYVYTNGRLVRDADMENYEDLMRLSICVKMGDFNRELQYSLYRLSNGLFPNYKDNETIYFKESHNYVIRNRVDYNNIYDLVLNDTLKHATQSIINNFIEYTIPERSIAVGEFGVIINHQEGKTNIINSKFKSTLRSICKTNNYYWICGDDGLLFRVSKIDFSLKKIDLDYNLADIGTYENPNSSQSSGSVITTLKCVSFFNDLRGVVVGKFNQIWVTEDGGFFWKRLNVPDFSGYNFNSVIYTNIDKFYVGGDTGIFIEFKYSSSSWSAFKRRVSKIENDDEYLLVDDVLSLKLIESNSTFITIGCRNNNIFIYDIDKYFSSSDFIFLGENNSFGDVTSMSHLGTQSLIFSTFNSTYQIPSFYTSTFSSTSSNILISTYSVYVTQSGVNSIYNYNDEIIFTGNESLWKYNFGSTYSDVYDSEYFGRIKPKLLFMDYDVGSKLYWFDDFGQYRLPSRYEIPVNYLIGATISHISFTENSSSIYDGLSSSTQSYFESNWITYWSDRLKTFEYYTHLDDAYEVKPSFLFKSSDYLGITFTYSSSDITKSYSDIQNLMPDRHSSRFREQSTPITLPSNQFGLYFYDYLGVWRISIPTIAEPPTVGDVLEINSTAVNGRFIINKIITDIDGPDTIYYQYFYTDFNENILNNIVEISAPLEIRNLNRYSSTLPNSVESLINNFRSHYISYAYDIATSSSYFPNPTDSPVGLTNSFQITAKYSQYSAYYNLQATIEAFISSGLLLHDEIRYEDKFLNFGYTPTYNLLSYLNFINNDVYTPNKEFLSLPTYVEIPGPDSYPLYQIEDIIYFDTSNQTNKLSFGSNIKHIWESIKIWTFVDITLREGVAGSYPSTGFSHTNSRMLITAKYYDDASDQYIIEFHDKLSGYNSSSDIVSIDIISRRKLQEISDDLQYINRIQRPEWNINVIEEPNIGFYSYKTYDSDINFKIPTDSYTKALLADSDIMRDLSGIIYTDYKYELAMQILHLNNEKSIQVTAVLPSVNSKYQISFPVKHGLKSVGGVVLSVSGTQSNWPGILGYHAVNYIDDYTIELNKNYDGFTPPDDIQCKFIIKDDFLNFQPIDIFDLGVGDKKVKQSIEIPIDRYEINSDVYLLKDIDFRKYRFRLIDGLDLVYLSSNFDWILDAEISGAVIGINKSGKLIWYKGTWECGRWFDGIWISGTWKSGDWYGGEWNSKFITDKLLSVRVDDSTSNFYNSVWYGGRWYDGTWNNGTWYDGRWYDGTWNNGRWFEGTWNDGTWNNGLFTGGIWVLGQWYNGIFNTDNKLSYWLDGKFLGGDFENGVWYNGEFNEKNGKKSRFGTKSFSSRNSTWHGGKFLSGEFHSFLNTDDKGLPTVSESHKYSVWNSGFFGGGIFYGGNVNNINFNSSLWQGGISNDIDIISINTDENLFGLDGIFRFNINDVFFVVDNLVQGTYSIFGSTENPIKYKVLDTTLDEENEVTYVFVDVDLSDIYTANTGTIDTGIKCVSQFKNSTWNSGIWFNGVFDGGNYNGGIWYQGNFSGIWG